MTYNALPQIRFVQFSVNGHVRVDALRCSQEQRNLLGTEFDIEQREGEFSVCVEPKPMLAILRKLKTANVTIEYDHNACRVQSGNASLKVCDTLQAIELPEPIETSFCHVVSSNDLKRALNQTIYACDVESIRYALNGAQFELEADNICIVATDSRRLTTTGIPATVHGEFAERSAVVPASALKRLLERLPKKPVDVVIGVSESYFLGETEYRDILFESDGWSIQCRSVAGRFPQWRQIVPADSAIEQVMQFDRDALIGALETIISVTDDDNRGVDFDFDDDSTALRHTNGNVKLASTRTVLGKPVKTLMLDPKFVRDYLKSIPSGTVYLGLIDSETAVRCMADGQADCVIMPLTRDM